MTTVLRRSTFLAFSGVRTTNRPRSAPAAAYWRARRWRGFGLAALATVLVAWSVLSVGLVVPSDPASAQPVVQPLPIRDADLAAAQARLARDPRDVPALIAAAEAVTRIGDHEAAAGFLARAEAAAPGDPKIKAMRASALAFAGNPRMAISLFAQAEAQGFDAIAMAGDRGLAYDLAGDPRGAQYYYALALRARTDDELLRRYALSLAIGGDLRAGEAVLRPLLERQDAAAWRIRAFMLAVAGQEDGAVALIHATMPAGLAPQIVPYLRYMPRLTPAQQAAAAHLGFFPRPSEIGRDDPRDAGTAQRSADAPLIPQGPPLGPVSQREPQPRRTGDGVTVVAGPGGSPVTIATVARAGSTDQNARRVWVQVASTRVADGLMQEWDRLAARTAVLEGRVPFASAGEGRARLLVGPFASRGDAERFVTLLDTDRIGASVWINPKGQSVAPLTTR